jgi:hypothetical protein
MSMDFTTPPGRHVFWSSPDGQTKIIRHCHGVFDLEYRGAQVCPTATFEKLCAYYWLEFARP